jgi:hypothetical protein
MLRTTVMIITAATALQPGCSVTDEPLEDPADETASWSLRDGELRFGGTGQVAELTLDNRSVLHFVEIVPGKLALLEEHPAGAASIASIPGLPPDASLADVFFAFSEPGAEIPAQILAASPLSSDLPAQGWARAALRDADRQVQAALLTTGACDDAAFSAATSSYGYDDRGTPDLRLNKVPRSSDYFESYIIAPWDGTGNEYEFHRYIVGGNIGSNWYDIDRYISRVAVCAIDTYAAGNPYGLAHPPVDSQGYENNHMGPLVRFLYREPGETSWHTALAKDFAASEVGQVIGWHFYTGYNWDWSTEIDWAGADDAFDIGHAVEDLGI